MLVVGRLITARRNLTPDQRQILIGRRYLREKLLHGGDRKSKGNICTLKPTAEKLADEYKEPIGKTCTSVNTAEKLADEYKVAPKTVRRYAETAKQFERL